METICASQLSHRQSRGLSWLTVLLSIGRCCCLAVDAASGAIPELDVGDVQHPRAPPTPELTDVPAGSSRVILPFEQGMWAVVVDDDMSVSEVRGLINRTCKEAGERNPTTGALLGAKWTAHKYGYERTEWWFEISSAQDVFETHFADLIRSAAERPVSILEIGSFEGASALWFAEHLLLHPDSSLICLDTWAGNTEFADIGVDMTPVEGRFTRNLARAPNNERVTAVKGNSMVSLSALIASGASSTFDIVYVDGSHTMTDVLLDGLLSFPLVKVGGLLVFDDINVFTEVRRATTAIVEALGMNGHIEILHSEEQLIVKKTAEDPRETQSLEVTMGGNPFRSQPPGADIRTKVAS